MEFFRKVFLKKCSDGTSGGISGRIFFRNPQKEPLEEFPGGTHGEIPQRKLLDDLWELLEGFPRGKS